MVQFLGVAGSPRWLGPLGRNTRGASRLELVLSNVHVGLHIMGYVAVYRVHIGLCGGI